MQMEMEMEMEMEHVMEKLFKGIMLVTCCLGTGMAAAEYGWFGPLDDGIPNFLTCIQHEIKPLILRAVLRHLIALWSKFAAVCLHKGMVIPPQQPGVIGSYM